MDRIFIITYSDGTIMLFANRQKSKDHQMGSGQFEADADTTLLELSDWFGCGKPETNFKRKIRTTHWAGQRGTK